MIDENLPDGSLVDVGVRVEKRWVLRNVGTSEWDDAVRAVRLSEALWGAPDAVELSEVVAPGAHTTLAVTLEATEPVDGSVQIRYQLERQGIPFGAIFWAELVTASTDRDAGTSRRRRHPRCRRRLRLGPARLRLRLSPDPPGSHRVDGMAVDASKARHFPALN